MQKVPYLGEYPGNFIGIVGVSVIGADLSPAWRVRER